MNILQTCFLDFLYTHGFEEDHIDNWSEGLVIYYFGGIGGFQISFRNSCIPINIAKVYLSYFNLDSRIQELNRPECFL